MGKSVSSSGLSESPSPYARNPRTRDPDTPWDRRSRTLESAERFGLAQLHQLRGRVGRGSKQSQCYLLTSDDQTPSKRLRAIESSQDGFRLAELDLELRGPGAIYGAMQHGALDLRIVKLTDTALISLARHFASEFISRGDDLIQYPELAARVRRLRAVTNLN